MIALLRRSNVPSSWWLVVAVFTGCTPKAVPTPDLSTPPPSASPHVSAPSDADAPAPPFRPDGEGLVVRSMREDERRAREAEHIKLLTTTPTAVPRAP